MFYLGLSSVQFSSVTQSCPTLCEPMNCSTPGLPVHHQLPQFTQTHVHQVSGFRKGRGTRDQVANIHWIMEKAREFQKNIYFCFIDYAKAFDCVDLGLTPLKTFSIHPHPQPHPATSPLRTTFLLSVSVNVTALLHVRIIQLLSFCVWLISLAQCPKLHLCCIW